MNQILDLFAKDPDLGLVFPPYAGWLRSQPNWRNCRTICEEIYLKLTGDLLPDVCPDFPAGSFFWARVKTLEPIFKLELSKNDFDEELGQLDTTLAHGIERIVGFLPEISGMRKLCVTIDAAYDSVN